MQFSIRELDEIEDVCRRQAQQHRATSAEQTKAIRKRDYDSRAEFMESIAKRIKDARDRRIAGPPPE